MQNSPNRTVQLGSWEVMNSYLSQISYSALYARYLFPSCWQCRLQWLYSSSQNLRWKWKWRKGVCTLLVHQYTFPTSSLKHKQLYLTCYKRQCYYSHNHMTGLLVVTTSIPITSCSWGGPYYTDYHGLFVIKIDMLFLSFSLFHTVLLWFFSLPGSQRYMYFYIYLS